MTRLGSAIFAGAGAKLHARSATGMTSWVRMGLLPARAAAASTRLSVQFVTVAESRSTSLESGGSLTSGRSFVATKCRGFGDMDVICRIGTPAFLFFYCQIIIPRGCSTSLSDLALCQTYVLCVAGFKVGRRSAPALGSYIDVRNCRAFDAIAYVNFGIAVTSHVHSEQWEASATNVEQPGLDKLLFCSR
jgi:hypothetical protein